MIAPAGIYPRSQSSGSCHGKFLAATEYISVVTREPALVVKILRLSPRGNGRSVRRSVLMPGYQAFEFIPLADALDLSSTPKIPLYLPTGSHHDGRN